MTYTIKQGGHYSGFRFSPFFRKVSQEFNVLFTPSCRYTLAPDEQADTSKIFGWTLGFPNNSVRWGWKHGGGESDVIVLCPYVHEDGIIVHPEGRTTVRVGENVTLRIERINDFTFAFIANGRTIAVHRFREKHPYFGYKSWPYFGGNIPAPHDMHILMT